MIQDFLNKPCYLIPLTSDEFRKTSTSNKIVLFVNNVTKELNIAVPILEKYGISNMENAINAEEKWYFYPGDKNDASEVTDGRPIFKLDCKDKSDVQITTIDDNDFLPSIRAFSNGTKTIKSKTKVKQIVA